MVGSFKKKGFMSSEREQFYDGSLFVLYFMFENENLTDYLINNNKK
jgi:hypothetical protein